jgi:hypothetical protein
VECTRANKNKKKESKRNIKTKKNLENDSEFGTRLESVHRRTSPKKPGELAPTLGSSIEPGAVE